MSVYGVEEALKEIFENNLVVPWHVSIVEVSAVKPPARVVRLDIDQETEAIWVYTTFVGQPLRPEGIEPFDPRVVEARIGIVNWKGEQYVPGLVELLREKGFLPQGAGQDGS